MTNMRGLISAETLAVGRSTTATVTITNEVTLKQTFTLLTPASGTTIELDTINTPGTLEHNAIFLLQATTGNRIVLISGGNINTNQGVTITDDNIVAVIFDYNNQSYRILFVTDAATYNQQVSQPPNSGWTTVNASGSTIVATGNSIQMSAPAASADDVTLYTITAPTPPYVITVAFETLLPASNGAAVGIGWRLNSSGLFTFAQVGYGASGLECNVDNYDAPGTLNANVATASIGNVPSVIQIEDNNTNRIVRIGTRQNLYQIYSVARTTFITPDELFIGINPNYASGIDTILEVTSWLQS